MLVRILLPSFQIQTELDLDCEPSLGFASIFCAAFFGWFHHFLNDISFWTPAVCFWQFLSSPFSDLATFMRVLHGQVGNCIYSTSHFNCRLIHLPSIISHVECFSVSKQVEYGSNTFQIWLTRKALFEFLGIFDSASDLFSKVEFKQ